MKDFSSTSITELAVVVAEHLREQAISVVLVGGLAVEIYSENLYLTKDIDMVDTSAQSPAALSKVMAELGFRKQGRVYINPSTEITVEFPAAPLWAGDELVQETTVAQLPAGEIPILRAEDVVKDRLAAFMHWRDSQSLVQAAAIMLNHDMKPGDFRSFVEREGNAAQFEQLNKLFRRGQKHRELTMAQLEADLAEILLDEL